MAEDSLHDGAIHSALFQQCRLDSELLILSILPSWTGEPGNLLELPQNCPKRRTASGQVVGQCKQRLMSIQCQPHNLLTPLPDNNTDFPYFLPSMGRGRGTGTSCLASG